MTCAANTNLNLDIKNLHKRQNTADVAFEYALYEFILLVTTKSVLFCDCWLLYNVTFNKLNG